METTRPKNIYDFKHVQGVQAVALLKDGAPAGKIIANWSDNPAGSVCTAQVFLYGEEWRGNNVAMIGRAGGYGYDKVSSALFEALKKNGLDEKIKVVAGSGNHETAFREAGFVWFSIC